MLDLDKRKQMNQICSVHQISIQSIQNEPNPHRFHLNTSPFLNQRNSYKRKQNITRPRHFSISLTVKKFLSQSAFRMHMLLVLGCFH